jgi:serine O-acetyltransferase
MFYYIIFLLFNSVIPATAKIGDNSRCNYGGIGVVIHPKATIGKNVIIGTNVTIGGNFNGKRPVIGDNVYISTGAKILGCSIGSNVIVGANSVVVKDVGDNVVVAGIPAKVIRTINMEEKKFLLKGEIRDFGEDSIGASRPLN